MAGKLRRLAGKRKRARSVLPLAYLMLAAKGALSESQQTEFRRLCAVPDTERE